MTADTKKTRQGGRDLLRDLVAGLGLRTHFQPIYEIAGRKLIGYEALARGPEGSELESPTAMFAAAEEADLVAELDLACQTAAITTAIDSGMRAPLSLFLNGELARARMPDPPPEQAVAYARARQIGLAIVFEQTERGILDDPGALILSVDRARRAGWGVALDDVGSDPRALSLLPIVDPDVIKLEMGLLQHGADPYVAEVAAAIGAEVERTGPLLIAEGVERGVQLERAQALGATHVQGYLFGRPGDLEPVDPGPPGPQPTPLRPIREPEDPFGTLEEAVPVQVAPRSLVLALSRRLEAYAETLGQSALLISSFQKGDRFAPEADLYSRLAGHLGFVGAVAEGMEAEPAPGVRGGDTAGTPAMRREWSVAVLSPQLAACMCARELDSEGRGGERRFEVAMSQDRALVAKAARGMLRHVAPLAPQA